MDFTSILHSIGLQSEGAIKAINVLATLLIVGIIACLVYFIIKKWLARIILRIASKTPGKWDDLLFDQKFFNRLGILLAPIVIGISLGSLEWEYLHILQKALSAWIVLATVMLISSLFDGVNRIYSTFPVSKDRPIKIFIQVVMIFLWCAAVLIIISLFTGQEVGGLLTGLAAMTAVLMLIFQDSILGFVAGIQLSSNNMVRIGDWIEMPSRGADGDVTEIGLTTVKVQNWDKTIVTIPTHKLVSESFTNWRGMEESRGRRIKRSINIDVMSIHYLIPEEIETLRSSSLLNEYMEKKIREIDEFNANRHSHLDERRLTNIGTFREYLESWIAKNPDISQEMTHMVRQLQPGPTGLPLEIYCFSARQAWVQYERVQADLFDHIYAVIDLFGLRIFQYSGPVVGSQK